MPIAMEKALKKVAAKKGLKGKNKNAFIYGTMRKTGWKPQSLAPDSESKTRDKPTKSDESEKLDFGKKFRNKR